MMRKQEGQEGFPDVWSTYLRTDDARATVRAAAEHGGRVHLEAMDVPEQGTMAMIADATGAAVGVWQPAGMNGYELAAEPGTPAWHELHTNDYAAAVTFYQDVFGWDTEVMSDTPEFRYTTLGSGDAATAGIMDASAYLPAGVPSNWQVYFAVEDTDAALDKAAAMGARVIDAPEDTPFGRLATLADPTGAVFKVIADTVQHNDVAQGAPTTGG